MKKNILKIQRKDRLSLCILMSFMGIAMIVTSCGNSNGKSADRTSDVSEGYFAEIATGTVAPEDISDNTVMEYANYQIETYQDKGAKETRYFVYPGFIWTLEFQPESDGKKVNVLSSRYDAEDYGAGYLDNGRLLLKNAEEINHEIKINDSDDIYTFGSRNFCVRNNAKVIADVDIDDIEQFIMKGKSDWDPDRTVYNVYVEQGLYNKIDEATPEKTYKSNDGMIFKIKLYKIPGNIDGVKAIVSGEIENPSDALMKSYEDEFNNYIYSVLTDDNYFYSEIQGEDEAAIGPRVSWSEEELRINIDPDNNSSDIVLHAIK